MGGSHSSVQGRRVCPAVGVMATAITSFAFCDKDKPAANVLGRDPAVDDRIMTPGATAC